MLKNNSEAPKAEEVTTAPPKATTKKKAKAKAKSKGDALHSLYSEVENLTKMKAIDALGILAEGRDENALRMGGVLARIEEEAWHGELSFKEFIGANYGIDYRKARYLIKTYKEIAKSGIAWEQVDGLGWTKLKEISAIVSQDNVKLLVQEAKKMTVLQLQQWVKGYMDDGAETGDDATPATDITTLTFKLHPDQKDTVKAALDVAKQNFTTEFDNVALENMSLAYVASQTGAPTEQGPPSEDPAHDAVHILKGIGLEAAIEAFNKAFPEVALSLSEK